MRRHSLLAIAVLLVLLAASAQAQFFVRLGDKKKGAATTGDVAPKTDAPPADAPPADAAALDNGDSGSALQTENSENGVQAEGDGGDVDLLWKAFVRWFRENGGIISSKLELKERNGRRGVYFKERMRRGETIVSFPRTLRMEEKSAMKSKGATIFKELKQAEVFPDLRMVLYLIYEKHNPDSFWKPYIQVLPTDYNNIMSLTDAELRKLLRRPGCENTHNLGVQMRRTFNRFFNQYKSLVEPNYPEMKFSREDLLWGFNTLVACGWGSGNDGTGDKMMVPFSELPVHRRESAQKATNRGFISAAKEYQAGEELTFDYGLLNDAVLAFYGIPTPDCRGLRR